MAAPCVLGVGDRPEPGVWSKCCLLSSFVLPLPHDYSFEELVMDCLDPTQDSDMIVRPLCVRQEPSSSSPAPSRGLLVAVACQCPVWAVVGRLCAEQTLVPVTCHSGVTSHLPP